MANESFVPRGEPGLLITGGGGTERPGAEDSDQGGDDDQGEHNPGNALDAPGALLVRQVLVELQAAITARAGATTHDCVPSNDISTSGQPDIREMSMNSAFDDPVRTSRRVGGAIGVAGARASGLSWTDRL